jgi:hypothetical protein
MTVDSTITPLIRAAVDLLTHTLAHTRRRLGRKKYEQLLSTVIAELLQEHPDIDKAKARLGAIEATGVAPSRDLLRTKSMLKAVEAHSSRRKKTGKPRKLKKKAKARKRA